MNNSLEVLSKIYKPIRITKINNCYVMKTMEQDIVVKMSSKINYKKLYNYLKSRNFGYFPKLISNNRDGVNVFEYVEDVNISLEQKALDLIKVVALLHSKTTYFKEVTKDKYKEIYETLENNLLYVEEVYSKRFDEYILEEYLRPSYYLFLRNYFLITNAIAYAKDKLETWYNKYADNLKQRVCLIHNNLSLDHFMKNEKEYLISWDNYMVDSPIIDLYKFYQKEWEKVDFASLLAAYNEEFALLDEEKMLLDIIISIPYEVKVADDEMENCRNYRKLISYLYKTSYLVQT